MICILDGIKMETFYISSSLRLVLAYTKLLVNLCLLVNAEFSSTTSTLFKLLFLVAPKIAPRQLLF